MKAAGDALRLFWFFAAVIFCAGLSAYPRPRPVDPGSFATRAGFSVDDVSLSLSTAIATIEPRLGAPGYSWLRIYFYSFPVAPEDMPALLKGDVSSMERKWNQKSSDPKNYNVSHAALQLSVDQNHKVWQVDMSIPGHTCTIAPYQAEVNSFLQAYQFDGKNLRLKSKGTYVCDMKFMGIPNQKFAWDVDLNTTVFDKGK